MPRGELCPMRLVAPLPARVLRGLLQKLGVACRTDATGASSSARWDRQAVSVRSQTVTILAFVGHIISVPTTPLCC